MMSFWWLELKCFWLTQDVKRWILDVWLLRGLGDIPKSTHRWTPRCPRPSNEATSWRPRRKKMRRGWHSDLSSLALGVHPKSTGCSPCSPDFLPESPGEPRKINTFCWLDLHRDLYIYIYYNLIDWGLSSPVGKPIKQYFMSWENWIILVQQ